MGQKVVRGFELLEPIGRGGFGAVYRAQQESVGREVAIKVILPELANRPEFVRRFEVEAQLIARLEHPHIVPLYDYWRDPSGAYLVMRLLPKNLREALREGSWPAQRAQRLAEQLSAALAAAHRQGVVHRDIKPENILLDEDDNAYLADFGIALDAQPVERWGESKSPLYLSPEQLKREPTTPQSDLYSLGLVLFEVLTGKPAFAEAATPEEAVKKQLCEPLPELPTPLGAVLQTATAKAPSERYADVARFAAAFRAAAATPERKPLQPLPEPLTERELDILRLMTEGLDNKEIAKRLYLSVGTVRWYVKQIYSKLDVHSRHHAILQARALRLFEERQSPPEVALQETPEVAEVLLPAPQNPYKGLRAFHEADAEDFFGRAALLATLLAELRDSSFLAVVGPSGSGKSSVVRAGLVPAVREGALPGSEQWFIAEMLPGTHPFEELEEALLRIAVRPQDELLKTLRADERGFVRGVRRALPEGAEATCLLVIDQFEELFTLVQGEEERELFISSLVEAATDPRSRLSVVVTLRADFYDRPLLYPGLGKLMGEHTALVLPLTKDELTEAIARPAERAGVGLEPGLVPTILNGVGEGPGNLPLLQYALTELFERREARTLTLDAYRATGGVKGALVRRTDELYMGLDAPAQTLARQLFLRLVTLGEGTEDTRRRTLQSELFGLAEASTVEEVLDSFGRYRLLTFDRDPVSRGPTVEIAHEALIREWDRLRAWLQESREDVRLQRLLGSSALEWEEAGRDPSYLLSGARLAQFEAWASTTSVALTGEERAFLDASLLERERQQELEEARQAREKGLEQRSRRFLQALAGVLLVATVVAIGLTAFAFTQSRSAERERRNAEENAAIAEQERRNAEESAAIAERNAAEAQANFEQAESQRLAAEATNLMQAGRSTELAALLSVQGLETTYTPQADGALQRAAQHYWGERLFRPGGLMVQNAAFSPDGRYALIGSTDSTVWLWDIETGEKVREFLGHTGVVWGVLFSPDGQYALTGSIDGTARLWNIETGEELRQFPIDQDFGNNLAFSEDSRYILLGNRPNKANLYDVQSGEEVLVLEGHEGFVRSVEFSADGRQLLTASNDGTARLWDRSTGEELLSVTHGRGQIYSAYFSPDDRYILTGGNDGTVRLWDRSTGEELRRFTGNGDGFFDAVYSLDGRFIITGSLDTTARLLDAQTLEELRAFRAHTSSVYNVAFSPDNRHVLTASRDGTARLWDIEGEGGTLIFRGHDPAFISGLAVSPDGRYVLTGSNDFTARLWDASTGEELHQFPKETGIVRSVAFSPDGRYLATGKLPGITRIFDAQTWEELHVFEVGGGNQEFSPDSRYLLTDGNKTAYLFDVQTGEQVRTFDQPAEIQDSSFSPDGNYIATAGMDRIIHLWDIQTGEVVKTFEGSTGDITSVEFSKDRRYLLSSGRDNVARLWDIETGEELHTYTGHNDIVWTARFSDNMRYVLTASQDRTARLWDFETGQELRRFAGHQGSVPNAVFSRDGTQVLTSGSDGLVIASDIDLPGLISSVCDRALPDLTEAERQQYEIKRDGSTCSQFQANLAGPAESQLQ